MILYIHVGGGGVGGGGWWTCETLEAACLHANRSITRTLTFGTSLDIVRQTATATQRHVLIIRQSCSKKTSRQTVGATRPQHKILLHKLPVLSTGQFQNQHPF